MKPLQHAKISAKKHGGHYSDYLDIHCFFDQTKAHIPDMRHRAILHNAFGIFLCAQQFGEVRTNSAGREYSVRDIGEDHVLEDLGTIPTLHEVISCISTDHLQWLSGLKKGEKKKKTLVARIPKTISKKKEVDPIITAWQDQRSSLPSTHRRMFRLEGCRANTRTNGQDHEIHGRSPKGSMEPSIFICSFK